MSTQLVSTGVTFPDATTQTTAGIPYVAPGTSGNVLQSNGSAWTSAAFAASGTLKNIQYFTTVGTATYTPTSGTNFVIVEVVGGGGGGGGKNSASNNIGGSGGGGGYARKKITSSFSGVTVTVGDAGTAGAAGANAGGAGGTSSFGALVSATGGSGGAAGSSSADKTTAGGSGSNGDLNLTGMNGHSNSSSTLRFGGSSFYGPTKITGSNSLIGDTGVAYGGGGTAGYSSLSSTQAGAAGSQGIVIVYEYA